MYYFTMVKRKSRGKRNSILERSAGNGYWHMNGQHILIKLMDGVSGHKTALKYYYYDKNKKGVQSKWIMNEYRLKFLAEDFNMEEELVLCRIQKTKTGSEVEEEINGANENQSTLITQHQPTLPQAPVSSVPSKRLRRDYNTCNGSQYYNTGNTSMAQTSSATTLPSVYQKYQCYNYNPNSSVPDQQYHQFYNNTTEVGASHGYSNNQMSDGAVACTSMATTHGFQSDDQQMVLKNKFGIEGDHALQYATVQSDIYAVNCQAPMKNTTVAPPSSDMQHASEATGNEEGDDFSDWMRRTIEAPSPSFVRSNPELFELNANIKSNPPPDQQQQQQQQEEQQHGLSNACAPVAPPSSSMNAPHNSHNTIGEENFLSFLDLASISVVLSSDPRVLQDGIQNHQSEIPFLKHLFRNGQQSFKTVVQCIMHIHCPHATSLMT